MRELLAKLIASLLLSAALVLGSGCQDEVTDPTAKVKPESLVKSAVDRPFLMLEEGEFTRFNGSYPESWAIELELPEDALVQGGAFQGIRTSNGKSGFRVVYITKEDVSEIQSRLDSFVTTRGLTKKDILKYEIIKHTYEDVSTVIDKSGSSTVKAITIYGDGINDGYHIVKLTFVP